MKIQLKSLLLLIAVCFQLTLSGQTTLENSQYNSIIDSYLKDKAASYNLNQNDIKSIVIKNESYSESTKITHIYLNQTFQNIPIHNAISSIAIKNDKVFYFANKFITNIESKINTITPSSTPEQAIGAVSTAYNLGSISDLSIIEEQNNVKVYTNGNIASRSITVSKVFFSKDNTLKLAWDVTIYSKDNKNWWRVKVDATTNEILETKDYILSCNFDNSYHDQEAHTALTASLFSDNAFQSVAADGSNYNVFALPVESPNHGVRSIVSNPASDLASPFGWHDDNGVTGPEYTITRGNNVWSQEDRNGNNGNGFAPDGTTALNFDFELDLNLPPSGYESASITNLFYTNNMMHDIWFHHGFDERSGNFQATNYDNFGLANDFVFADAQDGSGLNNATFGTPPDGQNPGMTMFLWDAPGQPVDLLTINNGALAGGYLAIEATFGAEITNVEITEDLVPVIDSTSADSDDNFDACDVIANATDINGKIAVIRRGNCEFGLKVLRAQQSGAIAAIIINNENGAPIAMGAGELGNFVNIPSVMVSQSDGEAILSALLNGETINGTLINNGPYKIDGSLDNVIIAHEYGHGISNRLTGGALTTDCLFNQEQMGEGWSDWFGLMVTMKATDTPDIARGIGTFATNEPIDGTGIRPARYSPDFSINPATYGLTNNEGLSIPHGVGFVWATVLWDLTWAYVDKYGYDPDLYNGNGGNNKVMQLVIDGLKLQPCSPGFVDGRDAILAADMATTGGEDQCLIWDVFAARGLGLNASQGSSNSRTDQIEDFSTPPINDPTLANCDTLSTDEFTTNSVRVYPNPTDQLLNLSTASPYGNVTITLVDINGRIIMELSKVFNSKVELDISQLNDGLYILTIKGDSLNYNTKIIKN